MKRYSCILWFIGLALLLFSEYADAQDFERLSERQVMGTARYVGMSGAMTAIGGDPSAVADNPAGLGAYRRSEVLLSIDYQRDRTAQQKSDSTPGVSRLFMLPQVSFIIAFGDRDADEGVVSHNLMFSYQRLRSYSRNYRLSASADCSLGDLLLNTYGIDLGMAYPAYRNNTYSVMDLTETGYFNQYSIDYAFNYAHRLYVGFGLRMYSGRFSAETDYYERFAMYNAEGKPYDLENENSLLMTSFGVGGSFGLIYRPCGWVRLGAAIHTPTVNTVNCYTSGEMSSMTDSLRYSKAPSTASKWTDYHAPLHASFGAALQVGDYGLLSLQYDYRHAKYTRDLHTLSAGLEIVPVPGLYLNAGYGYESTFSDQYEVLGIDPGFERQDTHTSHTRSTQYAGGAIGFRGRYMIAQLGYQYRWQRLRMHAHEAAQPMDINADTHRVVLTLGWHN